MSKFDKKKWVEAIPEITASFLVSSLQLFVGLVLGYSGVIIPQMIEEQNVTKVGSAIPITETDVAWISSATLFVAIAVSVFVGMLVDIIGRIKTIMLASIPGALGFILIATASNMWMIILGRVINGVAFVFIINPVSIYISEISKPDMRGCLLSLSQIFLATGMVLIYIKGWVLHWRTIAWVSNIYLVIPTIAIYFLPESPSWLFSKSRTAEAKKSLAWFHKHSIKSVETELSIIQKEQSCKQKYDCYEMLRLFLLPTFYKPFLILTVIFFLQQFSGTFIILLNCVIFFEEIGTKIDPYMASVFISSAKVVMSFFNTILVKNFRRRVLLLVSTGGMALTISTSGLFTKWLQQGVSTLTWVPLVCLVFYVLFTTMGVTWVPFMASGEMFPLKIRGVAYSIMITMMNVFTFMALQCYFPLQSVLNGSSGLQFFFATVCTVFMIFAYIFLPETHNYKLIEIENYFLTNTIYKSSKMRKMKENENETLETL